MSRTVFDQVRSIAAEKFGADESTLNRDTTVNSLIPDVVQGFLRVIPFFYALEKEFGRIDEDELADNEWTLGSLADYIEDRGRTS